MDYYIRTVDNGASVPISTKEALAEINRAQMEGKHLVREMSYGGRRASITYRTGETVRLYPATEAEVAEHAVTEDPQEWHGTKSHGCHMHRFDETNRARCNRRIHANASPAVVGGAWGVYKRTRAEIESSEHAHVYTFCPTCEAK